MNDLRGYNSSTKLWDVFTGNIIIANYGSQGAIDNDDSSAYYQALANVLAYGQMGMKSDFGGHDNYHVGNVYAYVGVGGYESEFHPHAYDGHENNFSSNYVVQTGDSFNGYNPEYIFGQTCNTTGPLVWKCFQGFVGAGGDVLPPGESAIADAKALCLATPRCIAITYEGDNSTASANVYYKNGAAIGASDAWVSWALPRETGIDVVHDNRVFTKDATVQECGMNLSAWQALSPFNDPGTTVAPFPADADLVAECERVIGLTTDLRRGA